MQVNLHRVFETLVSERLSSGAHPGVEHVFRRASTE